MSVVALLEPQALDPQLELAELTEAARGDGALVTFVGLARPESREGNAVDAVVLDHHPTLTRRSLEAIAVACAERFDVSHVRVVHRCGTVPAGEPIVFAGASSIHRRAAVDAADSRVVRLKTAAGVGKRGGGDDGAEWVEPTEADLADRDRWG